MTPIDEALRLLGDPEARGELEAAVAAFLEAEHVARHGPTMAAHLAAVAAASEIVAEAAADPAVLDAIDPCVGIFRTLDPEALAAAHAVELDPELVADFATLARTARQRLDAALSAPAPRWQLLQALASVWTSRGHKLGNGDGGRFHQFARAVGDVAGCEITHHSIRQVCAKWPQKDCRSHTARPAIAA